MKTLSLFAERLTELMQDHNLNNLQLEKICGCRNQSVSVWLTRNVYPKPKSLIRLSEYFNCSLDYLLGLTDDVSFSRETTPASFMVRIENILNEKQVTKYKIAKDCNFDRANFFKWKKRNLLPQTECLIAMSEYLSCSVEYLLGISDRA